MEFARSIFILSWCFSILLISCTKTDKSKSEENEARMTQSDTILVGTYTNEGSNGVYLLTFNAKDGMLSNQGLVSKATDPSFLTWSKDKQYFYAINKIGNKGGLSSFRWDGLNSNLLNHVSPEESSPCHVSINHAGNMLASANYQTGGVALYSLKENGEIASDPNFAVNTGKLGPHSHQGGVHAHCTQFRIDDKMLYINDLGLDEIIGYQIEDGVLGEGRTAIRMQPGDGPRHLVFNESGKMAFVINELSNSVATLKVDLQSGELTEIDRKSTLPDDFTGESYCADIHLSPDEKFLYASNRGYNSIAVFSLSNDGKLALVEIETEQIDWPRNFMVHPGGKHLLVANQHSNNVTVYDIDPDTGKLSFTGNQAEVFSPVCLAIK